MSYQQSSGRFVTYTTAPQRSHSSQVSQSLSGSETDVSTSNENLSNEEQYVIRLPAQRQEPQGQENLQSSNRSSLRESLPSNRSSLDVSSSSYNTLIIHSAGDESWTNRNSLEINNNVLSSHSGGSGSGNNNCVNNGGNSGAGGMQEITEIPDDYLNQSHVLKHLAKEVKMPNSSNEYGIGKTLKSQSPGQSLINRHRMKFEKLTLSKSQPDLSKLDKINEDQAITNDMIRSRGLTPGRRGGVSSAPRPRTKGREVIDSGEQIKSGGSEVWPSAEMVAILIQENSSLKMEIENLYQKVARAQRLEHDITNVHRAHEDLIASSERRECLERTARSRLQSECRRLQDVNKSLREQIEILQSQLLTARSSTPPGTHLAITGSAAADHLSNLVAVHGSAIGAVDALKRELSKRELLIAQLITQNKDLVAAKERQEIELAAQRATLQEQRTHIDILDTALTNAQGNVVRLEEECRKKQMYVERVAQLQRALSSLQLASDRREQTERKLRSQLERELRAARQQQNSSSSSQIEQNKNEGNLQSNSNIVGNNSVATSIMLNELSDMKRRLREKDEKIMRLETDCAKWEQRYLDENTLRQAAIDAASIPKDAKIAALEKNSQDAEKLIMEARTEKIRHMDEVHASQKKLADLESRLKDLESKLAERDAMIRVLQKHHSDIGVSSTASAVYALNSSGATSSHRSSPHHTPHHSTSADIEAVLASRTDELVNSVLSGSTGCFGGSSGGSSSGKGTDSVSSSPYHHHVMSSYTAGGSGANVSTIGKYSTNSTSTVTSGASSSSSNYDATKKSLDDQLKELDSALDSQLLSKRGLCCFPGFANSGIPPRKGKLPKPLFAIGPTASNHHQFEAATGFLQGLIQGATSRSHDQNNSRPEEMLLLEKQGRTSQQQRGGICDQSESRNGSIKSNSAGSQNNDRAGSLPPSSLPRPPARSSLQRPRRIGEYNRLVNSAASDQNSTCSDQADQSSIGSRKKSLGTDSLSSTTSGTSKRSSASPVRSFIPAPRKLSDFTTARYTTPTTQQKINDYSPSPRKLGEYGRLNESNSSLRKPSNRSSGDSGQTNITNFSTNRDSSTSDNISSARSSPSKLRMYEVSQSPTRRSSSLGRQANKSVDFNNTSTNSKYRIQF